MRAGTIKQFNSATGFGSTDDDLTRASHFVFYITIKEAGYKSLEVGQRVRYQLIQGKKGPRCINVYTGNGERGY